ncbi:hypothetical protein [Rhizobium laguerreae]|uniref:hypothetical protein n=1 Tax=Rhizobium laguerreae TaxID=1076926 RepID=UPI001C92A73B|nr:hypothetical protein [Rhizobium laguerreae]MBY3320858.1 hypothetical protein [Rhizobium laguerreae]
MALTAIADASRPAGRSISFPGTWILTGARSVQWEKLGALEVYKHARVDSRLLAFRLGCLVLITCHVVLPGYRD